MSTQGARDFRPKLHFTAKQNWINDPNGLVKINDTYHLFAQYNPEDAVWGPMHWYHGVSKDLIHWEHLPIALAPDELGTIFSGSAVYDKENRSGFGKDGRAPLVVMYTSHGETEQQSIAYSLDGIHFTKYEGNPVIPNPGLVDFRDPKMFWNPVHQCWSMVLAASDRVFFYRTEDFIHWEKTGEFGAEGNHLPGIWECTDLIPLTAPSGELVWVLLGSMAATGTLGQTNTQYFLGDFNGDTFQNTRPFPTVERIEHGFDNYAGVTYNNVEDAIFFGWATHWHYAGDTPTGEYCGQMTMPRRLTLAETPLGGLRLAAEPLNYHAYLAKPKEIKSGDAIEAETFELVIRGAGECRIGLHNERGQELRLGVSAENSFWLDRFAGGATAFHKDFGSDIFSKTETKRYDTGDYEIHMLFDVSIVEAYIDGGTGVFTAVVYPDTPYHKVTIEGDVSVTYAPLSE